MTAFQEVLYTVGLFVLFLVVVPVGIFADDLLKNYYIKEAYKNDMGRNSRSNPDRKR